MTTRARHVLLVLGLALPALALLPAPALLADTSPPPVASIAATTAAPGIDLMEIGIFCHATTKTTEEAPGTTLGYVTLLHGTPELAFRQQQVPARIGVHFGIVLRADRTIFGVRNETWIPDADRPEVWHADLLAGQPLARGFMFEYPEELRVGIWRMDAFDDDTRLYSVEWEVRPASALPGIGSDCGLVS